jgi:hypothetical protein
MAGMSSMGIAQAAEKPSGPPPSGRHNNQKPRSASHAAGRQTGRPCAGKASCRWPAQPRDLNPTDKTRANYIRGRAVTTPRSMRSRASPSLVERGARYDLSKVTLRPLGLGA